jgi:hypothetical protein
MSNRWRRALAAVGVLVPALAALVFIARFRVTAPSGDQLDFAPLFDRLYRHTLTLGDLYRHHFGQQLPVPRLAFLAIGHVTRYANTVEQYVGWCLLATIAWAWSSELRRAGASRLACVPIAFWVFALRQHENLSNSWQLQVFLSTAATVWCFHFLSARLPAALGCAWLASESFVTGFLVWPVGAFVLWRRRAGRRALAIWCAAGFAELAIYTSLAPRLGHPRALQSLGHPLAALRYAVGMLGATLTSSEPAAMVLGAALLVLGAAVAWRLIAARAPGLALPMLLVAAGHVVMVTAGRLAFGQPLSSRYTTLTLEAIVAIYVGLARLDGWRAARPIRWALVAVTALALPWTTADTLAEARAFRDLDRMHAALLADFRHRTDAELGNMDDGADGAAVRASAEILERYRLNVFRQLQ